MTSHTALECKSSTQPTSNPLNHKVKWVSPYPKLGRKTVIDIPTTINPLSEDELTQLAQECVKRLSEKPFLDFRLWVGGTEVDSRFRENQVRLDTNYQSG